MHGTTLALEKLGKSHKALLFSYFKLSTVRFLIFLIFKTFFRITKRLKGENEKSTFQTCDGKAKRLSLETNARKKVVKVTVETFGGKGRKKEFTVVIQTQERKLLRLRLRLRIERQ